MRASSKDEHAWRLKCRRDWAQQRGGLVGGVVCLVMVVAQKRTTSREILLWMTPSEAPKALQTSECSELLDPTGASYWIIAQR